ncbi:hypothetical protein HPP92_013233 [Vanilla planifolia]|uniref:Uncharacterized protein n=1 Tax=Vanilla planifolia TaxID=51239 RepID=A0A835UW98_VANPL|nr:hypothetical protein HPP92_013233 [Vanilla planifolia]
MSGNAVDGVLWEVAPSVRDASYVDGYVVGVGFQTIRLTALRSYMNVLNNVVKLRYYRNDITEKAAITEETLFGHIYRAREMVQSDHIKCGLTVVGRCMVV